MKGREDVDAPGKGSVAVHMETRSCLLANRMVVRMAPGDYLYIHGSTPLASRILTGRPAGTKNPRIPTENNQYH